MQALSIRIGWRTLPPVSAVSNQRIKTLRFHWFLHVVALPLVYAALYLFSNGAALSVSCERTADYQLLALSAELAKDGDAWTGAYSRFGFRHPGPIYAYLSAFGDLFLPFGGTPRGRHQVMQLLVSMLVLLAAAQVTYRTFRPRLLAPAVVAMTLIVGRLAIDGHLFHDTWNPSVMVAPMVLFLVSTAALLVGRRSVVAYQAIAAVLLLHAHLGASPVVILLLALSWFWVLRAARGRLFAAFAHLALCGGGILLLSFLPVFHDALVAPNGGNLGTLIRFFSSHQEGTGYGSAVHFVAWHIARSVGSDRVALGGVVFLITLLPALYGAWVGVRRDRAPVVVLVVALLLCLLAARGIVGAPHDYLMRYLFGVVAVLFAIAVVAILRILSRSIPQTHRLLASRVSLITMLLAGLAALPPALTPKPELCSKNAARLVARFTPDPQVRYRLEPSVPNDWPLMAAIALHLKRRGVEFCVDPMWGATFDWSLTCGVRAGRDPFPPRPLKTLRVYNQRPKDPVGLPNQLKQKQFLMAWE